MRTILAAGAACVALLANSANAADLPLKAPAHEAPPPAAPYDWTGVYIGGHGGYAWTAKTWSDTFGNQLADYTANDWIYGGQVGFNWQRGAWVFGAEAQASWGEIRKGVLWTDPDVDPWTDPDTSPVVGGRVTTKRIGTTVDRFGTIAGRLGYAFDRVLVFAKAGGAWAHDVYRAFDADTASETLIASASGTRWGWVVGGGVEYAIIGNWSTKIEFDYLDFGSERITLLSIPGVSPATRDVDVRQSIALVKVGINYRFAPTTH